MWALGAGWEMGLLALEAFLRGDLPPVDPAAVEDMPEVAALAERCSDAWAEVLATS